MVNDMFSRFDTTKERKQTDIDFATIQYNTIQCGYLVPPIHETGAGVVVVVVVVVGITIVLKCE